MSDEEHGLFDSSDDDNEGGEEHLDVNESDGEEPGTKFAPGPKIWKMRIGHFPDIPNNVSNDVRSMTVARQNNEIASNLQILLTWESDILVKVVTDETLLEALKAEFRRVLATANIMSVAVWSGLDMTDIYGEFIPGQGWRIALHHFQEDSETTLDRHLRNERICRANKRALHIWIRYGIDDLYEDSADRQSIREQCYEILRSQAPGADIIESNLHLVYDVVNITTVHPPGTPRPQARDVRYKFDPSVGVYGTVMTAPTANFPVPEIYRDQEIFRLLQNVSNRLADLDLCPDGRTHVDADIVSVLTIENNRRTNWIDDEVPVAPMDIYEYLGDSILCNALAQFVRQMKGNLRLDQAHLTQLLQLLLNMWMWERITRSRFNLSNPMNARPAPVDVPTFSDLSCPDARMRVWRVHVDHFGTEPANESPQDRLARKEDKDREVQTNLHDLETWATTSPPLIDQWVKDAVARRILRRECIRIRDTKNGVRQEDGTFTVSDPVVSDLYVALNMAQPLRIPQPTTRARAAQRPQLR